MNQTEPCHCIQERGWGGAGEGTVRQVQDPWRRSSQARQTVRNYYQNVHRNFGLDSKI